MILTVSAMTFTSYRMTIFCPGVSVQSSSKSLLIWSWYTISRTSMPCSSATGRAMSHTVSPGSTMWIRAVSAASATVGVAASAAYRPTQNPTLNAIVMARPIRMAWPTRLGVSRCLCMRTSVTFMSYTALVVIFFSADDHIKALNQFPIEHILCADTLLAPDFVGDLLSTIYQTIQHFGRVSRNGVYGTFRNIQPVPNLKRAQNHKSVGLYVLHFPCKIINRIYGDFLCFFFSDHVDYSFQNFNFAPACCSASSIHC
nr:MAG TPA: hypothetical protein [Caudoviricetes sp.]